jgi:hypothetical protein
MPPQQRRLLDLDRAGGVMLQLGHTRRTSLRRLQLLDQLAGGAERPGCEGGHLTRRLWDLLAFAQPPPQRQRVLLTRRGGVGDELRTPWELSHSSPVAKRALRGGNPQVYYEIERLRQSSDYFWRMIAIRRRDPLPGWSNHRRRNFFMPRVRRYPKERR